MTKLQQIGHLFALVPEGVPGHPALVRLRRSGDLIDASPADAACAAAWDGLPMVTAPLVVIRASRAADLAAGRDPLQIA